MFEAHGMSFPCTELLLFNYAKVNTVFHSMAPLKQSVQTLLVLFLLLKTYQALHIKRGKASRLIFLLPMPIRAVNHFVFPQLQKALTCIVPFQLLDRLTSHVWGIIATLSNPSNQLWWKTAVHFLPILGNVKPILSSPSVLSGKRSSYLRLWVDSFIKDLNGEPEVLRFENKSQNVAVLFVWSPCIHWILIV